MNYLVAYFGAFAGGAALSVVLCQWRYCYLRRKEIGAFVEGWRERLKETEELLSRTEKAEAEGAAT